MFTQLMLLFLAFLFVAMFVIPLVGLLLLWILLIPFPNRKSHKKDK